MKTHRLLAGLLLFFSFIGTVSAGPWSSYDEASFKKAQAEGKTVVLDFYADWCSTCVKQRPVLVKLLNEEKFDRVVGFKVNFDEAEELKKRLNVYSQATLIVFKGEKEVARNIGVTGQDELKNLIGKGIK